MVTRAIKIAIVASIAGYIGYHFGTLNGIELAREQARKPMVSPEEQKTLCEADKVVGLRPATDVCP